MNMNVEQYVANAVAQVTLVQQITEIPVMGVGRKMIAAQINVSEYNTYEEAIHAVLAYPHPGAEVTAMEAGAAGMMLAGKVFEEINNLPSGTIESAIALNAKKKFFNADRIKACIKANITISDVLDYVNGNLTTESALALEKQLLNIEQTEREISEKEFFAELDA